jgi:hypothetical protein
MQNQRVTIILASKLSKMSLRTTFSDSYANVSRRAFKNTFAFARTAGPRSRRSATIIRD